VSDFSRLMDRFKEHLKDQGLKYTRQRRVIAHVFFRDVEGHQSLNDLLAAAQVEQSSIGYATIYRTMKLMTECGVALEHRFADTGQTLYEPNLEGDHHDHIICLTCGRIVEFEDERIEVLQDAVARAHGFDVRKHRHEIYGDCVTVDCAYRPAMARG
jgi:Fur family ferric uptake transcriptional regulator